MHFHAFLGLFTVKLLIWEQGRSKETLAELQHHLVVMWIKDQSVSLQLALATNNINYG